MVLLRTVISTLGPSLLPANKGTVREASKIDVGSSFGYAKGQGCMLFPRWEIKNLVHDDGVCGHTGGGAGSAPSKVLVKELVLGEVRWSPRSFSSTGVNC